MKEPVSAAKKGGGRWVLLAIPVAVAVGFALFCSGVNFPVIGGQRSFENSMAKDLGIGVPASLKVEHAVRCAYRDPSYYYECDVGAADMESFKAQVEAGAKKLGCLLELESIDRRFSVGQVPPVWFDPDKHGAFERVEVGIGQGTSEYRGYWFFFCPEEHKIFVYWYAT